MPGNTGKRARPAGTCYRCGKQITASTFERDRKGDSHSMNADGSYPCADPLTGQPWEPEEKGKAK